MANTIDWSAWTQAIVAVVLCIGTATAVYTTMNSDMAILETKLEFRKGQLNELKQADTTLSTNVDRLRVDMVDVRSDIRALSINQSNITRIVDKLNTTLDRLNTTVIKLETRLDHDSRLGGIE